MIFTVFSPLDGLLGQWLKATNHSIFLVVSLTVSSSLFYDMIFITDRVLQHKNEIESDDTKQYADNEINGKFRITSEEWTEQLQDQNSIEFQELSTTLKSGLKELLEENQDLKEKANFDVEIVKLT